MTLARRLLAIGRVAGRRTEAGGVRFVALFLATLVLGLGLGSLVAVHAVYAGKEERRVAREPVIGSDGAGERVADATAWLERYDSLAGERQFTVVHLAPHRGDAPLPPGLDRWPEPGQVFLSPELRRAGAGEDIDHRYGRLAGTIGEEGLDEPSEWLAYVRPRDGLSAGGQVEVVTGFGPSAGGGWAGGDFGMGGSNDKSEWMFQAVVIGLLVLPASVLLVVAARTGAHARDRRTALVAALGGRRTDRALIAVGEAGPAAVLGAVIGAAAVGGALLRDLRIPHADYILSSSHLRAYGWSAAVLAPLAALLIVLTAVVLADLAPRRGTSGTRPRSTSRSAWLPRLAVLCPLWILLAVYGPGFAPAPPLRMLVSWVGIAGTVLTLPAALATVVAKAGVLLARRARAHHLPGTLVAGRRSSAHPGATARLVAGVSIALIVLMQAIAWQGIFGSQASDEQRAMDHMDRSTVSVSIDGDVSASDVADFTTRVPEAEAVLLTHRSGAEGRGDVTVYGDCAALTALRLSCPAREARVGGIPQDSRLFELFRWTSYGFSPLVIRRADARTLTERAASGDAEQPVLALVRRDGRPLSVPALKRMSHEVFPRGAAVSAPGGESGGAHNRDQGRWSALFGMVGIAVLVMAAGLSAMAEFLRQGRALAPLSVLTGGLRVFRTSAAWAVLAPLALAGTAGVAVATALAAPITNSDESHVTAGLILSATGVVLVVSVVLWAWASRVAVRQAQAWRPSGD
ncbi:ABC transporter permease [Streptomyces sp. NBC_01255]|uniref:ABC transporter permease n=1 Tax=Streptomyces sp. NBC_01255 TaxID=2903798 RepID=UPI002E309870|nr:ABC transporter permease [Streptomyces sp. NBC_01255]